MCLQRVHLDRRGPRAGFPGGGLQEKPGDGGPASPSFWFPGQLLTSFLGHSFLMHLPTGLELITEREGQGHGLHPAHKDDPNAAPTSRKSMGL